MTNSTKNKNCEGEILQENELDVTNYGYNIPCPADDVNKFLQKEKRDTKSDHTPRTRDDFPCAAVCLARGRLPRGTSVKLLNAARFPA